MLIEQAYAQTVEVGTDAAAPMPPQEGGLVALLPFILVFVVFYFFLIRPQQKKFKEHQQMVQSVRRGDKVVTGGGIVGTVSRVDDSNDQLLIEVAEGVKIKVVRSTLANVLTRSGSTEPGDSAEKPEKPEKPEAKKKA